MIGGIVMALYLELERFQVFVEGVFYVGKGKNSRSMQHMKDAKKAHHTPSKVCL